MISKHLHTNVKLHCISQKYAKTCRMKTKVGLLKTITLWEISQSDTGRELSTDNFDACRTDRIVVILTANQKSYANVVALLHFYET